MGSIVIKRTGLENVPAFILGILTGCIEFALFNQKFYAATAYTEEWMTLTDK